jgi:hypothetical protein
VTGARARGPSAARRAAAAPRPALFARAGLTSARVAAPRRSVFQQPRFKRGQRQLLKTIKRKTSTISGGHNGRLLTPKISTLLKDISDMRHELHTNSSRLALMETNLHAIAMRCEHLEHELHGRRAMAAPQSSALPPEMPAGVGRGPDT